MHRCRAKTRKGTLCRNWCVKGATRCRMHGGKTPRGSDSPNFKHGLYSKYASESLRNVLDELKDKQDEELINPENELRLMEALILTSKTLQSDYTDINDLEIISRIIDRLIFAKQRSQKVMVEQQKLIPVSDISKFLDFLDTTLETHVPEQAIKIMNEIRKFKIQ